MCGIVGVARHTWTISGTNGCESQIPMSVLQTCRSRFRGAGSVNRSVALLSVSVLAVGVVAACSNTAAPNAMTAVTTVQVISQVDTLPALGATQQLTAVARDSSGGAVGGKVVAWRSSVPEVVRIDAASGVVTAVNDGRAVITATVDGVSGSVQLTVKAILTKVPGTFKTVSVGASFACGVTAVGAASCWGDNQYGELGNGTTTSSLTPVPVTGGFTFTSVSAGSGYACGITTTGSAYCWGANDAGQLGSGATGGSQQCVLATVCDPSPVAVTGGLTFSELTPGAGTACGTTTSGVAYCWGANISGALGNGSTLFVSGTPVPVSGGLTVATISAGFGSFPYACAVTTSGAGYCWGDNNFGELGIGTTTGPEVCPAAVGVACSTVPVPVAGGLTLSTIQVGLVGATTCGVTTAGAAYCWGAGPTLGDGTTDQSTTPVAVAGGLSFRSVSPGYGFACGLTLTGKAYCWGDNSSHQLGTGTVMSAAVPVPVVGGAMFTMVSVGFDSTCGLTGTGTAFCWGSDQYGQLGGAPRAHAPGVPQ